MYTGKNSSAFNHVAAKYVFRFNVVTNFYEYAKKKKVLKWKKYDDRVRNKIMFNLIEEFKDCPSDRLNLFIEQEKFSPDYNPFEEFFDTLPKWDKKTDYIGKFAKTVKTDDPDDFRKTFERFLVGTLDCLLRTDSVNDVCLVFQSKQGLGKSRWMRSLLPKQFQREYLYEGNIDTKNKDHNIYLSQYWFIHLDELETLRSNEIGSIKSYITRQRITERKAYGRYSTVFVRRASFLGSVNEDKFLSDITGNRRWLVFPVKGIEYQHGLDPDLLWGQAYHLWKKGYRHWFNTEEVKELNEKNERFRTVSLEEELILRYFVFNEKKGKGELLSTSEVVQKLIANVPELNSKLSSIRTGKSLTKHSKHKKMRGGLQMYYCDYLGVEKPLDNPSPDLKSKGKKYKKINEEDDLPF